jgi:hypothetical protein
VTSKWLALSRQQSAISFQKIKEKVIYQICNYDLPEVKVNWQASKIQERKQPVP